MIILLAMHGNHYHDFRLESDADVKRIYTANQIDFARVVEHCRDFHQHVPIFENLVGSTVSTVGNSTLSRVNLITGEEDLVVKAPGKLVLLGYWATFESAIEALNTSVSLASFTEFQSSVVQGIASIEGYINYRVELWNKINPQSQLVDSRENKISFDEKINDWIPVMTKGKKFDKGSIEWEHFKILRRIRDDSAIHPKVSGFGVSLPDLAEKINMFRIGIAAPIIKMHTLFEERIPGVIIRARYAPDVEVAEVEENSG